MKRYKEYQTISLPWLNNIPANWTMHRNKVFLHESKDAVGNNSKDYILLSLTLNGIIPRDVSSGKGKFPSDFGTYKIIRPNDIVFCLFDIDETPRTVGLSNLNGMLTGAYDVFHISGINSRYLLYYYLYLDNVKALRPLYKGLRKTINIDTFLGTRMPVPPSAEQDQIVRYLDWQVSKINRLIAAKRKEIELLEATTAHYLENTIHKGIRNEQLVETGNPWINTAPKSWKKVRHKNVLTEKKEVVGENYSQYTLLSLTTKGVIIRDTSSGKGKYPSDFSTYQAVNPFDMVFCLFDVDETPRTVGLSTHTGMITGAYTVYETHDALPEYLLYYFLSIDNKKGFKPLYSGLRKVIGKDVFSRQAIYLPSIEEQKEIVDAIQIRQAKSRNAIDLLEREIESLHDLRTRLISDVVTGQVDVRGIEVPEFEYVGEADVAEEQGEESEVG